MRHDAQCAAEMSLVEFDIDTSSGAAALARLRALRKLSLELMRGNAWKMNAGLRVGAHPAGRVFQAGLARPAMSG